MSKNQRRLQDKHKATPTVISEDSVFTGSVKGAADVLVLGTVEGMCDLDNLLTVNTGGLWKGNVVARNMVLNGRIEGDIIVKGKLEIGKSGEVIGNVSAGFLAIAEGAVIQGDIKMMAGMEPIHFEEKRQA